MRDAELVSETTRFPYLALEEPAKPEVLAYRPGQPVDRRVRAVLLDTATGEVRKVAGVADRPAGRAGRRPRHRRVDGQPPIMLEEFNAVDEIVKADAGWRAAMARRGITDLDLVCPCPLSAGAFDMPGEEGRRMLRVLAFLQHRRADHPWAHPIDGVVAYVDLIERRGGRARRRRACCPFPPSERQLRRPGRAAARAAPRSSRSRSPSPRARASPSTATWSRWENWELRIGFDAREGLVLHQIAFADGGRVRPIVYRASIAEMVVPYGDPSPVRFWQNYFDTGEYLFGQQANSLEARLRLPRRDPLLRRRPRRRRRRAARRSRTRSACTRRTSACCGSTPTCSPARARPAASAGW